MKKLLLWGIGIMFLMLSFSKPALAWHPPIAGDTQPPVISTVYSSSLLLNNGGYLRLGVKATDNNYVIGVKYLIDNTDTYICFAYFNKCEMMFGPFSDTKEHRYDIVAIDQNGNTTPMWWGKFKVSNSTFATAYDRDQKRIVDLNLIKDGLNGFYLDNFSYPGDGGTGLNLGESVFAKTLGKNGWGLVTDTMFPLYLNKVPSDPNSSTNHYVYKKVGSSYAVTTKLEGSMNGLSGNIILTPSGMSHN